MQTNQPVPRRASRPAQAMRTTRAHPPTVDEISEDDRLYLPTYNGSSVIRYRTTEGHEVVQQGKRRFVLRNGPPPPRQTAPPPTARRQHRLFIFGTGMLVMVLVFMALNEVGSVWQAHQLDATYGMPRTYQTDAVVGHNGDSAAHPSHFTFENLHAKIIITEFPAGDPAKAIVYTGPPLIGQDAESVPVTGSFADINGDGKPDMLVQVMNQRFIYLNNGSKFVSAGP